MSVIRDTPSDRSSSNCPAGSFAPEIERERKIARESARERERRGKSEGEIIWEKANVAMNQTPGGNTYTYDHANSNR